MKAVQALAAPSFTGPPRDLVKNRSRNVLFIRGITDPTNKDIFLLDDKFISYRQRDHLQSFPFWGAGREATEPRIP